VVTESSSYDLTDISSKISYQYLNYAFNFNTGFSYQQGLDALGATSDQDADRRYNLLQAQYQIYKFNTNFTWNWQTLNAQPLGISTSVRTNSQYSEDYLWPNSEFAIGGAGSVRGFKLNNLHGSIGNTISLENNFTPAVWWSDIKLLKHLHFSLFYDYGTVSSPSDYKEIGYLTGTGISVTADMPYTTMTCTTAWPIDQDESFEYVGEKDTENHSCNIAFVYRF
jgi:hemolysin activation/secretion protein